MTSAELGIKHDSCMCSRVGGGCGKKFTSVAAFARHRTGEHGIDRRCRTDEEMLARGMVRNARGYWATHGWEER